MKRSKICVIEVLKREEREYIAESLYEEIVSFFSSKADEIYQVADSRTPGIMNTRKYYT